MASGKTRADHASGAHDDRVFAGAQAYWTLHQNDTLMERARTRYIQPMDSDILIEYGPSTNKIEIPGAKLWDYWHSKTRK
jgi:hypothetical protein